jgi:predicted GTPase
MSSSGTAATTTCRSTSPTSRSWWPTPIGPGTSAPTIDTASPESVAAVRASIRELNPRAMVIDAASPLDVPGAEAIQGKRILAIEDGPTLTHGEMKYGAGVLAALKFGAAEILDPRPWAVGTIARTFEAYPGIGALLPAMGYGEAQVRDLEATIARTPADLVLVATPIDLRRVLRLDKPALRVGYELQEIGKPDLADALRPLFGRAMD